MEPGHVSGTYQPNGEQASCIDSIPATMSQARALSQTICPADRMTQRWFSGLPLADRPRGGDPGKTFQSACTIGRCSRHRGDRLLDEAPDTTSIRTPQPRGKPPVHRDNIVPTKDPSHAHRPRLNTPRSMHQRIQKPANRVPTSQTRQAQRILAPDSTSHQRDLRPSNPACPGSTNPSRDRQNAR